MTFSKIKEQNVKKGREMQKVQEVRAFWVLERERVPLLSKIPADPTVGSFRVKKESCSIQRGQRVDYGFREFLQTP